MAILTALFLNPGRLSRSACCSAVNGGPPRPPPGPPRPPPCPAAGAVNPLGPAMRPLSDVMLALVRPHATPGCAAPGAPGPAAPPRPAPPPGAPPTPGTGLPDMKIAPFTCTPFFQRSAWPMYIPSGPLPAECAQMTMRLG